MRTSKAERLVDTIKSLRNHLRTESHYEDRQSWVHELGIAKRDLMNVVERGGLVHCPACGVTTVHENIAHAPADSSMPGMMLYGYCTECGGMTSGTD